jgi:hypothetical protein
MNVGPMGNGEMDPKDVAILHGIGEWMKWNGPSIHGTTRTPLPVQACGESTLKGNTIYLHVFDWPQDGRLILGGLKTKVKDAYVLADPRVWKKEPSWQKEAALPMARLNPLDISIQGPKTPPDKTDLVIVLECSDKIEVDPTRLLLPGTRTTLRVFDGEVSNKSLRFGPGKVRDAYVQNWSKTGQFIAWPVRLDQPAEFDVQAIYDAPADSAGGAYTVKLGQKALSGTVQSGEQVSATLGHVRLDPGKFEIQVSPTKITGKELMRLRSIVLLPSH